MKRVSSTAKSLLLTLFIATMLTLAGCSTGTLSGPDLETSDETTLQEAPPSYNPSAVHNEEAGKMGEKKKKKKGNTTSGNGGNSAISGSRYRNSG